MITLQEVKKNLNIYFEDGAGQPLPELDDDLIEQYIDSAIDWIRTYTGYALSEDRVTVYANHCGQVDTCLYPFSVTDTNIKVIRRATSAILSGKPNEPITMTIGVWGNEKPPQQLIAGCYKLITYMYENRDMYPVTLPTDVQMLINQCRRSATL